MPTTQDVILAAVLVATGMGHASHAVGQTERERFELFGECRPIDLVVESLDDDAMDIGLTRERIQTLAESRLRAARLYNAAALQYLYVRIGVMVSEGRRGGAYSIEVEYFKFLDDSVSEGSGFAPTWNSGSFGTHGGDGGFIMQALSEHVDRFLLEYLRVNEAACGQ